MVITVTLQRRPCTVRTPCRLPRIRPTAAAVPGSPDGADVAHVVPHRFRSVALAAWTGSCRAGPGIVVLGRGTGLGRLTLRQMGWGTGGSEQLTNLLDRATQDDEPEKRVFFHGRGFEDKSKSPLWSTFDLPGGSGDAGPGPARLEHKHVWPKTKTRIVVSTGAETGQTETG